jgi:hypothetical protein
MVLGQLQTLLNDVYALEIPYDVYEFLITDEKLAHELDEGGRRVDEKLLIAEEENTASVSLYLEEGLMERLQDNNPTYRLSEDNLEDFWKALEGVSHFTYYAWNALAEKSVTLLEMELQAEIDKFIGTILLLQQQGEVVSPNLHHWLFGLATFDTQLSDDELTRYQDANHYAAKYCLKLAPQLAGWTSGSDINRELCDFYRLTQPAKISHIEAA